MTARSKADLYIFALLFLFIIIVLQLVNSFVFNYCDYSINQQLFFGLVGNNLLASIVAIPIFIVLLYLYLKKYLGAETVLILAGLSSNLIDRGFYFGVLDYFSVFSIPKFNLADIFIVSGCLIIVYKNLRAI